MPFGFTAEFSQTSYGLGGGADEFNSQMDSFLLSQGFNETQFLDAATGEYYGGFGGATQVRAWTAGTGHNVFVFMSYQHSVGLSSRYPIRSLPGRNGLSPYRTGEVMSEDCILNQAMAGLTCATTASNPRRGGLLDHRCPHRSAPRGVTAPSRGGAFLITSGRHSAGMAAAQATHQMEPGRIAPCSSAAGHASEPAALEECLPPQTQFRRVSVSYTSVSKRFPDLAGRPPDAWTSNR
jgi:hypothetical protein